MAIIIIGIPKLRYIALKLSIPENIRKKSATATLHAAARLRSKPKTTGESALLKYCSVKDWFIVSK